MMIDSTYGIGDVVRFTTDDGVSVEGIVFAITVAEVAPGGVGFWYKVHLRDETEVEFEEAGTDVVVVSKGEWS